MSTPIRVRESPAGQSRLECAVAAGTARPLSRRPISRTQEEERVGGEGACALALASLRERIEESTRSQSARGRLLLRSSPAREDGTRTHGDVFSSFPSTWAPNTSPLPATIPRPLLNGGLSDRRGLADLSEQIIGAFVLRHSAVARPQVGVDPRNQLRAPC